MMPVRLMEPVKHTDFLIYPKKFHRLLKYTCWHHLHPPRWSLSLRRDDFQTIKEKFIAYAFWLFTYFLSRSFRISPLCHSISKLINLLFIQFTEEKVIQKRTTDHFSLWRLFREDCFGVFKVSKKSSSIH